MGGGGANFGFTVPGLDMEPGTILFLGLGAIVFGYAATHAGLKREIATCISVPGLSLS